jgi:phage/conjugal plasmid C-4 type zinc finger TraR family protein
MRLSQNIGPGSDEADNANDLRERTKALAMYQHFLRKRWQLEHARDRLAQMIGDICEACGRSIDTARLEVVPSTTRCVICQRRLEGGVWRAARA